MTPREILAQAYARSKANMGASEIDEDTEGLAAVQGALNRLYTLTARIKKEYFMVRAEIAMQNGKWALPGNVERVDKVLLADGTEVARVPWDNRKLYAGRKPAVYFMGRAYHPAGNVGDPVSGNLILVYSRTPLSVTLDQSLADDEASPYMAIWPAQHDGLLVDECAVYLALKDRRIDGEFTALKDDRNTKALLFIAHLDHVNAGEERRVGGVDRVIGTSLPDILSVLAGNLTSGASA